MSVGFIRISRQRRLTGVPLPQPNSLVLAGVRAFGVGFQGLGASSGSGAPQYLSGDVVVLSASSTSDEQAGPAAAVDASESTVFSTNVTAEQVRAEEVESQAVAAYLAAYNRAMYEFGALPEQAAVAGNYAASQIRDPFIAVDEAWWEAELLYPSPVTALQLLFPGDRRDMLNDTIVELFSDVRAPVATWHINLALPDAAAAAAAAASPGPGTPPLSVTLYATEVCRSVEEAFNDFRATFARNYSSPEEIVFRLAVFNASATFVKEFSQRGNETFTLALNEFADLTPEEFRAQKLGLRPNATANATGSNSSAAARRLRDAWNAAKARESRATAAAARNSFGGLRGSRTAGAAGGEAPAVHSAAHPGMSSGAVPLIAAAGAGAGALSAGALPAGAQSADALSAGTSPHLPSGVSEGRHRRAQQQQQRLQLPAVDWVAAGKAAKVRNQQQCGSCWAFSAISTVESHAAIAGYPLTELSQQQLVDCSSDAGNQACNGGMMDNAYEWIQKNGGICKNADYPYVATEQECKTTCKPSVRLSTYKDVPSNDETALAAAVAIGPVAVALEADSQEFAFYRSGIFNCPSCGRNLDHGVAIFGMGMDASGTPYWKVRNSWGPYWGESGYIRILAGVDMVGISTVPSYPVVVPLPTPTPVPTASPASGVPPSATSTASAIVPQNTSPDATWSNTATGSSTASQTPSGSLTASSTPTQTSSGSAGATGSGTGTTSGTASSIASSTVTGSGTRTGTATGSLTASATVTATRTSTATGTGSRTASATATVSRSPTITGTGSITASGTVSPSATVSRSAAPTVQSGFPGDRVDTAFSLYFTSPSWPLLSQSAPQCRDSITGVSLGPQLLAGPGVFAASDVNFGIRLRQGLVKALNAALPALSPPLTMQSIRIASTQSMASGGAFTKPEIQVQPFAAINCDNSTLVSPRGAGFSAPYACADSRNAVLPPFPSAYEDMPNDDPDRPGYILRVTVVVSRIYCALRPGAPECAAAASPLPARRLVAGAVVAGGAVLSGPLVSALPAMGTNATLLADHWNAALNISAAVQALMASHAAKLGDATSSGSPASASRLSTALAGALAEVQVAAQQAAAAMGSSVSGDLPVLQVPSQSAGAVAMSPPSTEVTAMAAIAAAAAAAAIGAAAAVGSDPNSHTGAIVGGILGGVAVLIVVVGLFAAARRRRDKRRAMALELHNMMGTDGQGQIVPSSGSGSGSGSGAAGARMPVYRTFGDASGLGLGGAGGSAFAGRPGVAIGLPPMPLGLRSGGPSAGASPGTSERYLSNPAMGAAGSAAFADHAAAAARLHPSTSSTSSTSPRHGAGAGAASPGRTLVHSLSTARGGFAPAPGPDSAASAAQKSRSARRSFAPGQQASAVPTAAAAAAAGGPAASFFVGSGVRARRPTSLAASPASAAALAGAPPPPMPAGLAAAISASLSKRNLHSGAGFAGTVDPAVGSGALASAGASMSDVWAPEGDHESASPPPAFAVPPQPASSRLASTVAAMALARKLARGGSSNGSGRPTTSGSGSGSPPGLASSPVAAYASYRGSDVKAFALAASAGAAAAAVASPRAGSSRFPMAAGSSSRGMPTSPTSHHDAAVAAAERRAAAAGNASPSVRFDLSTPDAAHRRDHDAGDGREDEEWYMD